MDLAKDPLAAAGPLARSTTRNSSLDKALVPQFHRQCRPGESKIGPDSIDVVGQRRIHPVLCFPGGLDIQLHKLIHIMSPRDTQLIFGSARNEVREVKLICWQGFTKSGQLGLMR
jgi:hypothetical protein